MKHWLTGFQGIALACSLTSCAAWHNIAGPRKITIEGDFCPDTVKKPTFDDEITHPVKLPWHEGMTLSGALKEAHLRPIFSSYIHVHRGSQDFQRFVGKHGEVSSQLPLQPGDRITCYSLEF
jgi:hypothetical protein